MKQHVENGQGVRYETRLHVTDEGGTVEVADEALMVQDADNLEIRIVAGTDYAGDDPAQLCDTYEAKGKDKSFKSLLADHITEYKGYFDRVVTGSGTSNHGFPSDK